MNTDSKKDAVPVSLVLRDGYLEVRGDCGGLRDKLRYYRKEIGREGYDRKVVTTHEDLFDESNDEQGELLVTMPGFAHKVLEYFRSNGIPWRFMDARTPMPAPNYARAFHGLRPYQVPLVGTMLKSGGGILSAGTGTGKTAVSAAVIRAYDRAELCSRGTPLCVFACPDRDINRKNWEEFHRWLPDRNIGLIMSGARNVQSDDVVCCTIDSLDHIDPDSVGILIVDEMHTSASRTRSERIAMFRKARKWGVSATPTGRFDGADAVSEGLYGPVVATFSYQDGVKSGALVPITVLWLPAPPPVCGLSTYAKFKKRDAKIRHGSTINDDFAMAVAEIFNCTPKDTQILGVMQFIEQMQHVSKFCSGTGCVHAETNPAKLASFPNVSAIKPSDRKRIYDAFRTGELTSMLSTMVWSTGVDFPGLSVVVNIGGGGSDIVAKQIPGRASRKSDGKDHAYIVDFVHKWDREDPEGRSGRPGPLLSNDFARRRAYKSLGFEQVSCNRISELPFVDQEKAGASRLASSILDPGTTLL